MSPEAADSRVRLIEETVDKHLADLLDLRRDLHQHPELSWSEVRTTALLTERLTAAGFRVTPLPQTGLIAEIGDAPAGAPVVALRADLDALPVDDTTEDPWHSQTPGVAHACGHDLHTAALLGAGLALAGLHETGLLPARARLLFQPAEEVMPGGALQAIGQGVLADVSHIFGLHCDPSLDVGHVGLREGPITGAADRLEVRLSGGGGHTSRPHLTEDLVFALGKVITELPAILSRRLDPRAGVSVVWGLVSSGAAHNVIPEKGLVAGTVRMLDAVAWADAEQLVRALVDDIVAPYGVQADVDYTRGVPPVVNEHLSTHMLGQAVVDVLGEDGLVSTQQSLGGEDFGWYIDSVPGAMARLGTRTPGGQTFDLHQGNLRIDERSLAVGARLLAGVALRAMVTD
ncbi:MAG: amidohydrolase [Nocardioides sp.]